MQAAPPVVPGLQRPQPRMILFVLQGHLHQPANDSTWQVSTTESSAHIPSACHTATAGACLCIRSQNNCAWLQLRRPFGDMTPSTRLTSGCALCQSTADSVIPRPLQNDCASTVSCRNSFLESGGAVSSTGRASSACAHHSLSMAICNSAPVTHLSG